MLVLYFKRYNEQGFESRVGVSLVGLYTFYVKQGWFYAFKGTQIFLVLLRDTTSQYSLLRILLVSLKGYSLYLLRLILCFSFRGKASSLLYSGSIVSFIRDTKKGRSFSKGNEKKNAHRKNLPLQGILAAHTKQKITPLIPSPFAAWLFFSNYVFVSEARRGDSYHDNYNNAKISTKSVTKPNLSNYLKKRYLLYLTKYTFIKG